MYLHVEAPDETGHEGILDRKIQAIEEFDHHIVGEMLRYKDEAKDVRILVAPRPRDTAGDQNTQRRTGALCALRPGHPSRQIHRINEPKTRRCSPVTGPELFDRFIK